MWISWSKARVGTTGPSARCQQPCFPLSSVNLLNAENDYLAGGSRDYDHQVAPVLGPWCEC